MAASKRAYNRKDRSSRNQERYSRAAPAGNARQFCVPMGPTQSCLEENPGEGKLKGNNHAYF